MSGFAQLAAAADAARAARPGVPLALATLVEVEGSSYRQPGARLLVDAEARVLAGAISGGCLEGDVAARATAVCTSGRAALLRYDLRDDLETIWGFGSACDGIATILLEPLLGTPWFGPAEEVRATRRGGALVTLYGRAASDAVHDAASDALGDAELDGTRQGTLVLVADGIVHALHERSPLSQVLVAAALECAFIAGHTARPARQLFRAGDQEWRLFADPLEAPVSLHLVGAGRGAEAFARIGSTLGWDVTVIDHRPALLDALALPDGVRVLRGDASRHAGSVPRDARVAVALLTHIYDTDAAWLAALLPHTSGYVGVLGSRQRAMRLLERLEDEGVPVTPAMARRLHAPIGLDLGGESPESIALAAMAEIEAWMHGRPGGSLRERRSPIHERTPVPRVRDGVEQAQAISPSCAIDTPEAR